MHPLIFFKNFLVLCSTFKICNNYFKKAESSVAPCVPPPVKDWVLCGVCVNVGEQGVQMDKMYSSSSVARFFSLPLLIAVTEVHVCICDGVGAWTFFSSSGNVVHLKVVQC